MVVSRPLKRVKRVVADYYSFNSFGTSACPAGDRTLDGPFRSNIKSFLISYADGPLPPKISSPPFIQRWQVRLRLDHQQENVFVPLHIVEENVRCSDSLYCDHCRVVAGWQENPVCRTRYHFIIQADNVKKQRCASCISASERCKECELEISRDTDLEDETRLDLEDERHLLHGIIHVNGFGHLLRVNGREGGSRYLFGCDIMGLWDRICIMLKARKISVMDVSKKYGLDYRLLHAVQKGHPWYGNWGYEFGRGSFGTTHETYKRALQCLSKLRLDLVLSGVGGFDQELKQIVSFYRSLSKNPLVTVQDLVCFIMQLLHKFHNHTETKCSGNIMINKESTESKWAPKVVDEITAAMLKVLQVADGTMWITWHDLRGAICHGRDPQLLNYALMGLEGKTIGNQIVQCQCNSLTRTLEYRYEQCWLPLLAEHTLWGDAKFQLVVPLDCEWIWHCHRLNPVQYGKDCNQIYGRILDASYVESSTREADRKETEMIWKYLCPEEPYELDLSHSVSAKSPGIIFRSMLKIQYDLIEAVRRQSSFFHQVSRPHMFDDRFLKGAEERYKGFLYLIKKNRDNSVNCFCVPTYDIDLMWHSHQLQPIAYTRDMLNLLGKMLDHDDMDSDRSKGKKLDVGFTETKIQWESTFGRRYWRAGAMHRGDAPSPVPLAPFLSENCDREDTGDEDSDCSHEPLFHSNKDRYHTDQTPVKTVEVLLEVVGIKNIPNDHRDLMFVRFYRDNCPGMEAKKVQINSKSRSKPIASFQCTATGNFIFELRSRSSPTAKKASKVVGQASIPMQTLLDSTTLSIENWFPLSRNERWPVGSEPMSLHIAVSITPSTSSYLLWSVMSHSSERKFQLLELILGINQVKTVKRYFDHDDNEIFTVKTRKTAKPNTGSIIRSGEVSLQGLPDKRRIVTVYQRNPNSKPSRSYGKKHLKKIKINA